MLRKCWVETILVTVMVLVVGTGQRAQADNLPGFLPPVSPSRCFESDYHSVQLRPTHWRTYGQSAPPAHDAWPQDKPYPFSDQNIETDLRWLAMALMMVMVAALLYASRSVVDSVRGRAFMPAPSWEKYVIPLVALAGSAMMSYLASGDAQPIEVNAQTVNSGPVALQKPHVPVIDAYHLRMIGQESYVAIFLISLWALPQIGRFARQAYRTIFVVAVLGTLLALYHTYVTVFEIGAVCSWCLSFAITMTLLMTVSLVPALQGFKRPRAKPLRRLRSPWKPLGRFRRKHKRQ